MKLPRLRWDEWAAVVVLIVAAVVAGCLLVSCGRKAPAPPVIIAPDGSRAPPAPDASAPGTSKKPPPVSDVDRLRAELAAAEQRERDADARAIKKEQAAQLAIAQAQAKYGVWIAGIIAGGSILYTVAAFAFGLPRQWGVYGAAGAVGLLVGARLWTWLADKALIAGLILLGLGAIVAVVMLVRDRLAAKTIAEASEAIENAKDEAERQAAKLAAAAKAKARRVVGLVAAIRGKPVKKEMP